MVIFNKYVELPEGNAQISKLRWLKKGNSHPQRQYFANAEGWAAVFVSDQSPFPPITDGKGEYKWRWTYTIIYPWFMYFSKFDA